MRAPMTVPTMAPPTNPSMNPALIRQNRLRHPRSREHPEQGLLSSAVAKPMSKPIAIPLSAPYRLPSPIGRCLPTETSKDAIDFKPTAILLESLEARSTRLSPEGTAVPTRGERRGSASRTRTLVPGGTNSAP